MDAQGLVTSGQQQPDNVVGEGRGLERFGTDISLSAQEALDCYSEPRVEDAPVLPPAASEDEDEAPPVASRRQGARARVIHDESPSPTVLPAAVSPIVISDDECEAPTHSRPIVISDDDDEAPVPPQSRRPAKVRTIAAVDGPMSSKRAGKRRQLD